MSSATSILVYGRDPRLIDTRSLLLRRAGYTVLAALSLSDVIDALPSGPVDLLLLCHSLMMEDCERAIALTRAEWPASRTLVLIAGLCGCKDVKADAFLYATEGPIKLLEAVSKLVERKTTANEQICKEGKEKFHGTV